jgi:hypothetical protein
MDWRCDSRGRASALQAWSPEFKPQSRKKKKKKKKILSPGRSVEVYNAPLILCTDKSMAKTVTDTEENIKLYSCQKMMTLFQKFHKVLLPPSVSLHSLFLITSESSQQAIYLSSNVFKKTFCQHFCLFLIWDKAQTGLELKVLLLQPPKWVALQACSTMSGLWQF